MAGLPAETVVARLTRAGVPFSEVSAHRATLEEAYLELTRDVGRVPGAGDAVIRCARVDEVAHRARLGGRDGAGGSWSSWRSACAPGAGGTCRPHECALPVGPGGEEVTDRFTFAHRTLTGDGSITARVASFTGELPSFDGEPRTGLVPWAKAGLILKDGTGQGSAYAAVMLTGGHGVRMQHNFTHDTAATANRRPGCA